MTRHTDTNSGTRRKLLDAIDKIAPEEVSENVLLEILVKRASRLTEDRAALEAEREDWQHKVAGAYGDFWFVGEDGERLFVQIRGGKVCLYRFWSNFDQPLKQITRGEFMDTPAPVYPVRAKRKWWQRRRKA